MVINNTMNCNIAILWLVHSAYYERISQQQMEIVLKQSFGYDEITDIGRSRKDDKHFM